VHRAAELLRTSPGKVLERLETLQADAKSLRAELDKLRRKLASGASGTAQSERIEGTDLQLVFHHLEDGSVDEAKVIADQVRTKSGEPTVAFITLAAGGSVTLAANPGATGRGVDAGKLLQAVFAELGGRGGGRADFAQGKLNDASPERTKPVVIAKLRAMIGA
jgi:alanyl-tRNA synthetase